jgi:hypothetical protein
MITSSRLRRYQCKSCWNRRRLRMGYITSWPGPWYVTCAPAHPSRPQESAPVKAGREYKVVISISELFPGS